MLHVADHHISPGKKQWTWGNGDFGHAWDRNLTDSDGPYIELMTGVFTDNQPDFSWLQPNEIKTFEQYFMPYAQVGAVRNATKEALVNIFHEGSRMFIKVYTTSLYEGAKTKLFYNGLLVKEYVADLSPKCILDEVYEHDSDIIDAEWEIVVEDRQASVLVSYRTRTSLDTRYSRSCQTCKIAIRAGQC